MVGARRAATARAKVRRVDTVGVERAATRRAMVRGVVTVAIRRETTDTAATKASHGYGNGKGSEHGGDYRKSSATHSGGN
jgi:hypothetical protein